MAYYRVVLKPSAEKDLRTLPTSVIARVVAKIDGLKEKPVSRQAIRLAGGERLYRIRVGDYRIIYAVERDSELITVHYVRHRRDVYRRR